MSEKTCFLLPTISAVTVFSLVPCSPSTISGGLEKGEL